MANGENTKYVFKRCVNCLHCPDEAAMFCTLANLPCTRVPSGGCIVVDDPNYDADDLGSLARWRAKLDPIPWAGAGDTVVGAGELARLLGVNPCTISEWTADGNLPSEKIRGRVWIGRKQAAKWILGNVKSERILANAARL